MKVLRTLLVGLALLGSITFSGESGFTQEDRERLIRLEATLKVFMEQVDKRFEQMNNFLWIITGIFTTLTVSVIAFAWWDRRTIIREAKRQTLE